MHVLMISLDTAILSQKIGNSRARHEVYASRVGQVSLVVCNRRQGSPLTAYNSSQVVAHPTNSLSYIHYLWDGYRAALRIASECPVDLITSQEPFLTGLIALLLRRRLKVPVIIQDHSSFLESAHFAAESPRNLLLRTLAGWLLPQADAVRVVNHREKQGCIRRGIAPDKVCVIPLAPDIKGFAAADLGPQIQTWREKLQINPDQPVVLWVGRPVGAKNLPLLISAFQQVHAASPETQFVIVGDMTGSEVPSLVERCGLSGVVRLPGPIAYGDLPALYQMADIYAMSSNYEGLPGVLLEASAAGLGIVSTDNNGAADLIRPGETGIIVPIGDAQALAQSILELVYNPVMCKALGTAARQHVLSAFDEQYLVSQWLTMWQNVIQGKSVCAS